MKKIILALCLCLTPISASAAPMVVLAAEAQLDAGGEYHKLQEIESILQEMVQIRGLELKRPVQINTIDREQLRQKLLEQIENEIPPEKIAAEEALYKHLKMLSVDFDYRQFLVDLYTEQIGGFYDPKTQELRLIKGLSLTGLEQQMLIAHELTHALQDQHYHLEDYMKSESDNDDRTLAQMALIEGDATLAASEYVQRKASERPISGLLEAFGSVVNAFSMTLRFEKFRTAPRFIREGLVFPYDQGTQFVSAFREKGWSWEQMSELYQRPPHSTEQILHIQNYLDDDEPAKISFSLVPYFKDSHLLATNVWGELGYRQYLRQYMSGAQARQAAAGWQGDRYQVVEHDSGYSFAFVSQWENSSESAELLAAYRESLQKRYHTSAVVFREGELLNIDSEFVTWTGQIGTEVIILENLPVAQSKSLIAALIRDRQKAT